MLCMLLDVGLDVVNLALCRVLDFYFKPFEVLIIC